MIRVVLYQGRPAGRIPPAHLARIRAARPDFLCLPEYFWVPAGTLAHGDAAVFAPHAHAALAALSRDLNCVIVGGSYVAAQDGALYNTCPVYDRGRLAGEQQKVNPTPGERAAGVAAGSALVAIPGGDRRLGVLICADVLLAGSFDEMRALGVDLVFAPTLSPYLPFDTPTDKEARDRAIFCAGAIAAAAPVFKTCGVGRIFGGHRLQGRSLAASATGAILARVPFHREQRAAVIVVEVEA